MKKILITLITLLFTAFLFAQNENPYSQFGYEAPVMSDSSKTIEELFVFQISNSDINSESTYLVIEAKHKLVKYYNQNGLLLKTDSLKHYNLARWLTTDPAKQFHSPYLSMGNNPIVGIDPDGAESSPIMDFDGNHLGNDSEGFFGEIMYMDPSLFTEGMDHGKVLDMVSDGKAFTLNGALSAGKITIHALRNTINNILEVGAELYNIDMSHLYNGSVSIHSFASIYSNATWDCWDVQNPRGTANATAYMEGSAIKVNYFVKGGSTYTRIGRIFGGTVNDDMTHSGNIISAFVHEYLGHGNSGNFRTSEAPAYRVQYFHPSLQSTSPAYRVHVTNRYHHYNGN